MSPSRAAFYYVSLMTGIWAILEMLATAPFERILFAIGIAVLLPLYCPGLTRSLNAGMTAWLSQAFGQGRTRNSARADIR